MKKIHDRVLARPAEHGWPELSRMNCDGVHTLQPSCGRVERMVSGAHIDKAKRLLADIERFEQNAD
jgi:hypothetical protein